MKRIARSLGVSMTLVSMGLGVSGCSEPETIPPTPDAASKGKPASEALAPAEKTDVTPPAESSTTPPAEATPPAEGPK